MPECFVESMMGSIDSFCLELVKRTRVFIWLSLVLLVTACGGSGGGGIPDAAPPPILPPSTSIPTVTLSGTITVAPGAVVDGDVNDPNAVNVSNDTYETAQPLPNPVTLGGYLNKPGTGYIGGSFLDGDTADFYSIGLVSGQTITLTMMENPLTVVDLDLVLLDENRDVINRSASTTDAVEQLTVTATGNYTIMVNNWIEDPPVRAGYSSYTLRVGVDITQAKALAADRLVLSDAFVPGEMILKFSDGSVGTAMAASSASRASSVGLQLKEGHDIRHAMLMGLGDKQHRQATFNALGVPAESRHEFKFKSEEDQLKHDTLLAIKALRNRPDVLYAEPNYMRTANAVPNDPLYSSQWHYPLINLPAAWDNQKGDVNVTVAIIDTGVLMSHPDLKEQFAPDLGYDFISNDLNSGDGQPGIDNDPNDTGDSGGIGSSSFHGTHVAGTVAAATSFSVDGVGVAGVAPGVKLLPVRVLGQFGGTNYDIMQGVRYAAGLPNDSGVILNPSQRADVINLSFGGDGYSQLEQDIYTQARAAGAVVVAAAGNDNSRALVYPASYAGVISVSSVDRNKQKAYYSNYGSAIDVAAPGGDVRFDIDGDGFPDGILSTRADDSGGIAIPNYNAIQGTSMAAPHMAGVVALMKSAYSDLMPEEVDSLLSSGAIVGDIGAPGRDDLFGYGLIDAHKAVIKAIDLAGTTRAPSPALLVVSPSGLNLGDSATTALLDVSNGGGDALNITTVSNDADWLTVTAETVDADLLGFYRVTIDKSSLTAPGIYQAGIRFNSSVNSVVVPVTMQILTKAINGDAGYQYVLLIDASDFSVQGQWSGNVQGGGRYSYQFDNVIFPEGRQYYVIGGTDINNDSLICDPGEACGAYFSLSNLSVIDAEGPHGGLDFVSGFDAGVGGSPSALLKGGMPFIKRMEEQTLPELKGLQRRR